MRDSTPSPQINVSKIQGGGGIAGTLFAAISVLIFLIGIPAMRYFLPAAMVLGGGIAIAIRSVRYQAPGAPWIPLTKQK
jgi:hypothetical protein